MPELIYLSGPMASWPEHNYPAFEMASRNLRAARYRVISPHELGEVDGWSWSDYLRRDLAVMLSAGPSLGGVATLPDGPEFGYPPSRGRALEIHVASELGIRVAPVEWWLVTVDFTVPIGETVHAAPWYSDQAYYIEPGCNHSSVKPGPDAPPARRMVMPAPRSMITIHLPDNDAR